MLTWPIISGEKSKRPTFTAKAIAKYGREVDATVHISQAARPRHFGMHARPELSIIALGNAAYVSGVRKSPRNGRVRTADE
jgi:hypothetical protein